MIRQLASIIHTKSNARSTTFRHSGRDEVMKLVSYVFSPNTKQHCQSRSLSEFEAYASRNQRQETQPDWHGIHIYILNQNEQD